MVHFRSYLTASRKYNCIHNVDTEVFLINYRQYKRVVEGMKTGAIQSTTFKALAYRFGKLYSIIHLSLSF